MANRSYFLTLPDDVLIQVLSYCDPAGLLQLSRTCELLRCLLNDSRSSHIWATSRSNVAKIKCQTTRMFPFGVSLTEDVEVPFPDRLRNVSEQAFARLMCEEACSVCSGRHAKPYPGLQRRLCPACVQLHCIQREDMNVMFSTQQISTNDAADFNSWLSSIRLHCSKQFQSRGAELFWRDDVRRHSQKLMIDGQLVAVRTSLEDAALYDERQKFERSWRDWVDASQAVKAGEQAKVQN